MRPSRNSWPNGARIRKIQREIFILVVFLPPEPIKNASTTQSKMLQKLNQKYFKTQSKMLQQLNHKCLKNAISVQYFKIHTATQFFNQIQKNPAAGPPPKARSRPEVSLSGPRSPKYWFPDQKVQKHLGALTPRCLDTSVP